jgi:hypothetical protein
MLSDTVILILILYSVDMKVDNFSVYHYESNAFHIYDINKTEAFSLAWIGEA